jgi:hypothetical protein
MDALGSPRRVEDGDDVNWDLRELQWVMLQRKNITTGSFYQ